MAQKEVAYFKEQPGQSEKPVSESELNYKKDALLGIITKAIELSERIDLDLEDAVERLAGLRARLEKETLNLAVLGQFKRGKSTLLSALLGADILPTSVVPVTAVPTFITGGMSGQALMTGRVFFLDERPPSERTFEKAEELREFLLQYTSEEKNPANVLRVSRAEVIINRPVLEQGVSLIDTPGIGSTYSHNTLMTMDFLKNCDAALFVVSADPPITEVELSFLKKVKDEVPRLFFIFNKMDYLSSEELEEALGFLKRILEKEGFREPVIFPLSSRKGLAAKLKGDKKLLEESGLEKLEKSVFEFLSKEKRAALVSAVSKKCQSILNEGENKVKLALKAATLPLEEVERRLLLFDSTMEELRRQKTIAADILEGDKRRLKEELENISERIRNESKRFLGEIVRGVLLEKTCREEEFKVEFSGAVIKFFDEKLLDCKESFRKKIKETLVPAVERARKLIEAIKNASEEIFETGMSRVDETMEFEIPFEPYWVTGKWETTLSPVPPAFFDRFYSAEKRRERIVRRYLDQIEELAVRNVENLRWAILRGIEDGFIKFTSALEKCLEKAIADTRNVIEKTLKEKRIQGSIAGSRIEELEKTGALFSALRESLF